MNRDEMIAHLRAHLTAVKSGLPATHWPAHVTVNSAHVDALLSAYDDLKASPAAQATPQAEAPAADPAASSNAVDTAA